MKIDDRRNEVFAEAMEKLMDDKLGMSLDLLDEIIEADADDKLALLARGSVYLKMGKADEAIHNFDRVADIDSNHSKAFHLRGLAREMMGDNDEALSDLNRAIDINPDYGAAYYSRATLLSKMGQEDLAAEDMKMVTHLTNLNIENFANENNLWRSRQLQVENFLETEMQR